MTHISLVQRQMLSTYIQFSAENDSNKTGSVVTAFTRTTTVLRELKSWDTVHPKIVTAQERVPFSNTKS